MPERILDDVKCDLLSRLGERFDARKKAEGCSMPGRTTVLRPGGAAKSAHPPDMKADNDTRNTL